MKLSKYCDIFHGIDGFQYLFSCLSLKWVRLEVKLGEILNTYKDDIIQIEHIHPEFYTVLLSEGFIVNDDDDDIQRCIEKIVAEYNSLENLVITINPTLDCNLHCWYCYEQRHAGSVMSESTVLDTISYIKNLINRGETKSLRLSFFGGEPLLYYNKVVNPIVKSVYKICKDNCVELNITFTTNGLLINTYLLSELEFISSNVNFQIAFDGSRAYHDSVKSLGDNFSCYDRTIANAKAALVNGYNVIIRCNYNKKTVLSFVDLIEQFKEYHNYKNLRFLFQRIWQENEDDEMMALRRRLIKEIDLRFTIKSNLHDLLGNSIHKCYADYRNNVIINYDGSLYKCTARDFNTENSIGRITTSDLSAYDDMRDAGAIYGIPFGKRCVECRIMPICPNCSQIRKEFGFDRCPISIDKAGMKLNIGAAFQDLSGIKLSN